MTPTPPLAFAARAACCIVIILLGLSPGFDRPGRALAGENADPPRLRLACATFPMWLAARNVAAGVNLFEFDLILPAMTGCPHDYEPTPRDVLRAAQADALILNGLGFDDALLVDVLRERKGLAVIDASKRDHPAWIRADANVAALTMPPQPGKEWITAPGAAHAESEWNPHYFASPEEMALSAIAIARGLTEHFRPYLTTSQNQMIQDNARRYETAMKELAASLREGIRQLPNRRIVISHDAFAYFASHLGLQIVGVIESHPGVEPSPAELRRIVEGARRARAGGVFSEPQGDPAMAMLVAEGVGVKHGLLDPVAGGPADAPLDYYQKAMRMNLVRLGEILGGADPE